MNDSFTCNTFFIVFPLHGFEKVSYEVGMAESVGICEAISYLLSLFRQQTLYLYFMVIELGHGHPYINTFLMFLIFYTCNFRV